MMVVILVVSPNIPTHIDSHLGINSSVFAPVYAAPEGNMTVDALVAAHYDFARNGYRDGRFDSPRYDLPTTRGNSYAKEFNHNTVDILLTFGKEMAISQLPILVYHNVANLTKTDKAWYNSTTTTPDTFDAEMSWLKQNNYLMHSLLDLVFTNGGFRFK